MLLASICCFFTFLTSLKKKLGWYEDNWFETNLEREGIECTVEQMREAAEGHLTTEALMWNQNANQTTISGMTSEDFRSVFIFNG